MPRRNRDDTRAELRRLTPGMDLYRDWRMAMWRALHGPDAQIDPNEFNVTGAVVMDEFDAYTGPHYGHFLKDIQGWYAATASDLTYFMKTGDQETQQAVATFLADFKSNLGFSLFDEAGLWHRTVKKVLTRGHIANDQEWAIIQDILIDTDQTTVSPEDLTRIASLTQDYEAHQ
ncbi:hypothetical protein [Pseudooceanicola sp. MF1-13]|uniref:hypothetical protein n=1 Tax=Pseudooceanicola sp. MF1-13 TaxID=3379095 RepID=UPI0038913FD9